MAKRLPNPIDKYVGSRVRMRRIMLKLSQEKLGDALGLTFQQVQKYEKGTNRIGASRLHRIAGILQVPVSFFFEDAPSAILDSTGKGQLSSPSFVSDFMATRDGISLAEAFMSIRNKKLQRQIVELIEQIAADPARRVGVFNLDDFFGADVDDAREDFLHHLDDRRAAVRNRRRHLNHPQNHQPRGYADFQHCFHFDATIRKAFNGSPLDVHLKHIAL